MQFTRSSFSDGDYIPAPYAFCAPDPKSHCVLGHNRNPALSWSGLPKGTRSLALICHDPDAPSKPDDVNKEEREVPANLPRVDFFHWVLIELAPDTPFIQAGEFSDGVTPHGKPGPAGPRGARQGINDYTNWFAGDEAMRGDYFGYDGPCPPWNDAIPHRYVFTLHALDVARLSVTGTFTGNDTRAAMQGHVLAQASLTGRYSLNPRVRR